MYNLHTSQEMPHDIVYIPKNKCTILKNFKYQQCTCHVIDQLQNQVVHEASTEAEKLNMQECQPWYYISKCSMYTFFAPSYIAQVHPYKVSSFTCMLL